MRAVHANLPSKSFTKPSGVVTAKICLDSGDVATESCTRTETEYFVKGTVPSACEAHTTLTICTETGKIANEYCTQTEEKTYIAKPAMENTTSWTTKDDGKYDIPTETCDVHKTSTKKEVEVPNVVGKKSADAKKTLEDKNLKVEIVYDEDKNKDDGVVLKQSKEEKTKVEEGTTITITVNKITKQNENNQTNTAENTTVENTTTENTTVENNTTTN
jgi:penicillin-binding protein 1A